VAGELLIKYLPIIVDLQRNFSKRDKEADDMDIKEILDGIPQQAITNVCKSILQQTQVQSEDLDSWEDIDPEDFDNLSEMSAVVSEAFKVNYPDFFGQGLVTVEEEVLTTVLNTDPSQPKAKQAESLLQL